MGTATSRIDLPLLRSSRADRFYRGHYLGIRRELRKRVAEVARRVSRGLDPTSLELRDSWKTRAKKILSLGLAEIVKAGAQFAAAELTVGGGPFRAKQAEILGGFGLPLDVSGLDKKITELTESMDMYTWGKLTKIFEKAAGEIDEFGQGPTPRDIASRLVNESVISDQAKARVIARTNVIWAHNEGAMQTYRQVGVGAMQWLTTQDDLLCDFCEAMDGVAVAPGNAFWNSGSRMDVEVGGKILGLKFRSDVKHPPLHPNCRCTIVPVLDQAGILEVGGRPRMPDGARDAIRNAKDIRRAGEIAAVVKKDVRQANKLFKKTTKRSGTELKIACKLKLKSKKVSTLEEICEGASPDLQEIAKTIVGQRSSFEASLEKLEKNLAKIEASPPVGGAASAIKFTKEVAVLEAKEGFAKLRVTVINLELMVTKNKLKFSPVTGAGFEAVEKRLAKANFKLRRAEEVLLSGMLPNNNALKVLRAATSDVRVAVVKLKAAKKALKAAKGIKPIKPVKLRFKTRTEPNTKEWRRWKETLSKEQVDAFENWTAGAYGKIRKCQQRPRQCTPETKRMLAQLDSALATAPKYEGTTYRGMSLDKSEYNKIIKKGKFETSAFASTSRDIDIAQDFAIETFQEQAQEAAEFEEETDHIPVLLEFRQRNSGSWISDLSSVPEEDEVLFTKGRKFKVVNTVEDRGLEEFDEPLMRIILEEIE